MADNTPTRSTRFPKGLDDRFTEYRDERDMTNSEALRSLVRAGLEEKNSEDSNTDGGGGGRPRGLIGSLLYDARRSRSTNLGIAMVLLFLHFGLALSPLVDFALLVVTGAYALSAVFGYVEVIRASVDPDPADADRPRAADNAAGGEVDR